MALQPRFEAGMVKIRRSMTELEDELLRFPRGRHDDLIDALSYCLGMISPAAEPSKSPAPKMSFNWLLNKVKSWKNRNVYIGNENISDQAIWGQQ